MPLFTSAFIAILLSGYTLAAVDLVGRGPASEAFPLVSANSAAPIVLPPDAPEVVKIAARDLASDIAAVSGTKSEILTTAPADRNRPGVELVIAPDLAGRWEAFRLSAKPGVLTIDNIAIGKVRGKKNDCRNAEGVKEANGTIGELLPADAKKK